MNIDAIPKVNRLTRIRYFDSAPNTRAQADLTFVLIHGLGNSASIWCPLEKHLARPNVRVLSIDVPGFAESPPPKDAHWSLHSVARECARFITDLKLQDVILVGHSLGSYVALELATISPNVSRVILVDGFLFQVDEIVHHITKAISAPRLSFNLGAQFALAMLPIRPAITKFVFRSRMARQLMLRPFVANASSLLPEVLGDALGRGRPSAVLRTMLVIPRTEQLASLVAQLKQPLALIWGEDDKLIGQGDLQLARSLGYVTQETILANCGHWPMLEAPERLADSLLALSAGSSNEGN